MECPYLHNNEDGSLLSYNTYTCKVTFEKLEYDRGEIKVREVCFKDKHYECPNYKKAR